MRDHADRDMFMPFQWQCIYDVLPTKSRCRVFGIKDVMRDDLRSIVEVAKIASIARGGPFELGQSLVNV